MLLSAFCFQIVRSTDCGSIVSQLGFGTGQLKVEYDIPIPPEARESLILAQKTMLYFFEKLDNLRRLVDFDWFRAEYVCKTKPHHCY